MMREARQVTTSSGVGSARHSRSSASSARLGAVLTETEITRMPAKVRKRARQGRPRHEHSHLLFWKDRKKSECRGRRGRARFLTSQPRPSLGPAADPRVRSQLLGVCRADLHDHQGPQPRAPSSADQAALLRVQTPTAVKRGKVAPGLRRLTCC